MTIPHAIILSAGQSSHVLPVTEDQPKCLNRFAGRSLIDWQIAALAANGIADIPVATGFPTEIISGVMPIRVSTGAHRPWS